MRTSVNEPPKTKVPDLSAPTTRCIDCEHIVRRQFCGLKGTKINRKKLHDCELFEFREDKTPAPPVYVPAGTKEKRKRARKFLRELVAAGATVDKDGTVSFSDLKVTPGGEVLEKRTFEIPRTTADAAIVGTEAVTGPSLSDNRSTESE